MKRLLAYLSALVVLTLLGVGTAHAQDPTARPVDCRGLTSAACEQAQRAVAQGRYRGPQAPTTQVMTCVRVYIPKPADGVHLTEVVWTRGTRDTFRQEGMVIARQRPGAANIRFLPGRTDLVAVETCIPQAWLEGVTTITLCNGSVPNEGYGWQVSQATVDHLKGAQRHPGTFIPLVPAELRLSPEVARETYARYMRGEGARLDSSTRATTPSQPTAVTGSGQRVVVAPVAPPATFVLPLD